MASIREAIEYDISQAEAGLRQLSERLGAVAKASEDAQAAAKRQAAEAEQLSGALGRVQDQLQGVTPAQRQLIELQEQANRLMQAGTITADEHAAALATIGARQTQMASVARTAATEAVRADDAVEAAHGRLGAASSNLRSQMLDVFVGIQGGTPTLTILSQQGPQIAEAFMAAEGAGAALLATMASYAVVLGPIIALVGSLGYAWHEASEREKEATERTNRHADALRSLADAAAKVASAQNDTDLRAGLLTGEYSQADADEERARKAASGVTQAERTKVQEQLSAEIARQNVVKYDIANKDKVGVLFRASTPEMEAELKQVGENIAELERRLGELDAAENTLATTTVTVVQAEREAAEKTKERASAVKDAAAAEDAAQKALDARAEAIRKATQTYAEAQDPLLAYRRRLEEIAALESAGALTGADAAAARYTAAAQATASSRDGGAGNAADLAAEQARADARAKADADAAALAAEAARKRYEGTLDTVSGLGGQVLGGDAVGALSSGLALAGPEGAAVGALLSGLSTLGAQGADQIAASLQAGLEGLIKGIEELPDLLAQLPDILQTLIPAMASALVEAGPEIAWALAEAQIEMLATLPETIGEALYEAFQRVIDQLRELIQDPGEALFGGGDRSLGNRLRGAGVTAGRVALGVGTAGASEIALGVANAATDGRVKDALYGDGRGSEGRRSSRRAASGLARADRQSDLRGMVPRDSDYLSTTLADGVRRADSRLPDRSDPTRNS